MSKFTPWFKGTVRPVRVGWYDSRHIVSRSSLRRYWNGTAWLLSDEGSALPHGLTSAMQTFPHAFEWRGLAQQP